MTATPVSVATPRPCQRVANRQPNSGSGPPTGGSLVIKPLAPTNSPSGVRTVQATRPRSVPSANHGRNSSRGEAFLVRVGQGRVGEVRPVAGHVRVQDDAGDEVGPSRPARTASGRSGPWSMAAARPRYAAPYQPCGTGRWARYSRRSSLVTTPAGRRRGPRPAPTPRRDRSANASSSVADASTSGSGGSMTSPTVRSTTLRVAEGPVEEALLADRSDEPDDRVALGVLRHRQLADAVRLERRDRVADAFGRSRDDHRRHVRARGAGPPGARRRGSRRRSSRAGR